MDNEKVLVSSTWDDELHEECGVFGIYDFDGGRRSFFRYIMVCWHYSTEDRRAAVLPLARYGWS